MHTERDSEWVARLQNRQDECSDFTNYEEGIWKTIKQQLSLDRKLKRYHHRKLAACLLVFLVPVLLMRSVPANKFDNSPAFVAGGIRDAFHVLNKITPLSRKQIAVRSKKPPVIKNNIVPLRQMDPDSVDKQIIAVNDIQPVYSAPRTDSLIIIVPSGEGSGHIVNINELGIDPKPVSYLVKFYKPKTFSLKKKPFTPDLAPVPEETSFIRYLKNNSAPGLISPGIKN